jgi:hypothetical protein
VVRRIYDDRAKCLTVREICGQLSTDRVPSRSGKPTWGHSTLCRLLRNEAQHPPGLLQPQSYPFTTVINLL